MNNLEKTKKLIIFKNGRLIIYQSETFENIVKY